jgi:hypothetical protein
MSSLMIIFWALALVNHKYRALSLSSCIAIIFYINLPFLSPTVVIPDFLHPCVTFLHISYDLPNYFLDPDK